MKKKISSVRKSSKPRRATKKPIIGVSSKSSGWSDSEAEYDHRHGFLDAAIGVSRM